MICAITGLQSQGIKDMMIFAPGINAYTDYISTLDRKPCSREWRHACDGPIGWLRFCSHAAVTLSVRLVFGNSKSGFHETEQRDNARWPRQRVEVLPRI